MVLWWDYWSHEWLEKLFWNQSHCQQKCRNCFSCVSLWKWISLHQTNNKLIFDLFYTVLQIHFASNNYFCNNCLFFLKMFCEWLKNWITSSVWPVIVPFTNEYCLLIAVNPLKAQNRQNVHWRCFKSCVLLWLSRLLWYLPTVHPPIAWNGISIIVAVLSASKLDWLMLALWVYSIVFSQFVSPVPVIYLK